MALSLPNELEKRVNAKLAEFKFTDALIDLHAVNAESEPELIAQKIKILCLLGDIDSARVLFYQTDISVCQKITIEMVKGLLGNLRFDEGIELLLRSLKSLPDSLDLMNLLFSFFITFNAFDDLLVLLDKRYFDAKKIAANYLLRLVVRLQINQRTLDSQRVLALFMVRLQGMPPMQVPWLLLSHGNKQQANALLAQLSEDRQQHRELLQTHYFYLRAELPELFNQLIQQVNNDEITPATNLQFNRILDNQVIVPPVWESIDNRIMWRYLWQYEGKNYTFDSWLHQKSALTALQNTLPPFLSTDDGVACLMQRKGNIHEQVLSRLSLFNNKPFVLVTSHSIVPGAIAALMTLLPDLYYIKSAVIPVTNLSSDKRAINLGPRFMGGHNLYELSRMDRLIKKNKKLLIFMDQRSVHPGEGAVEHLLAGQTVCYNNFFAPYVWSKKLPSFWIDARYHEGQLVYELADMPDAAEFEHETDWEKSWLDNYHTHIEAGFYGGIGVGNNTFHLAEKLIPQAFAQQFRKISECLQSA